MLVGERRQAFGVSVAPEDKRMQIARLERVEGWMAHFQESSDVERKMVRPCSCLVRKRVGDDEFRQRTRERARLATAAMAVGFVSSLQKRTLTET
jgi:hypothetical protein